jgi:hypothetical protein
MITAKIERKCWNYSTGPVSVTTTGTFYKLSSVPQDVTDDGRVGDAIHMSHMELRYSITVGATGLIAAADEFNTVRLLIFKWLEDDGLTVPTTALILSTIGTAGTNRMHSYDTRHLYKVYYDKQHVVYNTPYWNGAAVAWAHGVGANFATPTATRLPVSGPLVFDADQIVGQGHIYALLISDSAFTPNPTMEVVTALVYDDG